MQALIGSRLLSSLKPQAKPFEVWDERLKGFLLRVQPSGAMSYICQYARGKRITIGKVGVLKPAMARERAQKILADYVLGTDPAEHKVDPKITSLKEYVDHHFGPWHRAHAKTGDKNIYRLEKRFVNLLTLPLEDISSLQLEKWRAGRLKDGVKANTVNRDIAVLKAALNRAVEWGFIAVNPIASVKPLKIDSSPKVRFLDEKEEGRLRDALDHREQNARRARASGNKWKKERGYSLLPDLHALPFVDHLKPMVLLSLNSGLRRGEVFHLLWENVDLKKAMLTVVGGAAKSGVTRHVPLNSEALDVLKKWRKVSAGNLVFPGREGKPLDNIKSAWTGLLREAKITSFRWHDMRHHFASKLVMAGVDLNTVRELLGHSDLKMTLRYAHLAPHVKANAVEKLISH